MGTDTTQVEGQGSVPNDPPESRAQKVIKFISTLVQSKGTSFKWNEVAVLSDAAQSLLIRMHYWKAYLLIISATILSVVALLVGRS